MRQPIQVALPVLAAIVAAAGWAQEDPHRYDLRVENGKLFRGKTAYTIRAITVPDLGRPGTGKETVTRTLNAIAEVGGNAVCFDLYGIDPSGEKISDEGLAAMQLIRDVGQGRHMIGICRLFGPQAPDDRGAREAAARNLGDALSDYAQLVYLIDGQDARRLVQRFRRRARALVVAAERGGGLHLVPGAGPDAPKPTLQLYSLPSELTDEAHFILPEGEASYAQLEAASAHPLESQPWEPDNSILTEQERAEGWIALFDGKTLNGWIVLGNNPQAWVAHDGILERVAAGSQGLRTRDRYDNFVLRFEWNLPAGGNNGVHLRAPRNARASKIGLEFQMLGDYGQPPTKNSTGSIYDVVPPKLNAGKPQGEWNTTEITLNGPQLRFVLNGIVVQDLNMDENEELAVRLRKGFIVLTEHNAPVQYRNIRLKKL